MSVYHLWQLSPSYYGVAEDSFALLCHCFLKVLVRWRQLTKVISDGIGTANDIKEGSDKAQREEHPRKSQSYPGGMFKFPEHHDEDFGIAPPGILARLTTADHIRRRSGDPDPGGPEPAGRILQALLQAWSGISTGMYSRG